MRYLSVCSGIESATAAWHPLGWKPVAYSEIEPFPCAVLAHHYPETPNWGDMTKYKEWPDANVDLLVGGTPCQSFSVAGLRKGLDDPRGNLMLTYLAIAGRYLPKWVVWENVPGVLSDKTNAVETFLDGLEQLGYIIDIDILDAQFHGVAQRRRRVFICGQHRDDLLQTKTDSSALTIAQCLQEILHSILIGQLTESGSEPQNSGLAYLSKDGAARRMKLFGLLGDQGSYLMLRENLIEAYRRCQQEPSISDAPLGEQEKEPTQDGRSMDSLAGGLFTLTEQLLKVALDESYEVMKLFTTSMAINTITTAQIYTCSQAALLIAKLIQRLNQSCPPYWSAASSSLISIKEYINYARSASSSLFTELQWVQPWVDFIREAEQTSGAIGNTRVANFGSLFLISDSLSGNPAPSREKAQGFAADAAPSLVASGREGGATAELGDEIAGCLWASTGGRDKPHALAPVACMEVAGTMKACRDSGGWSNSADHAAAGYMQVTRDMQVRRLTPIECERLQGFPDEYTNIKFKGKPVGDGQRYKALGNSKAVPVVGWIGRRIEAAMKHQNITSENQP